ncbi:hypothetical protein D3C80_2175070 [compost metagenome]
MLEQVRLALTSVVLRSMPRTLRSELIRGSTKGLSRFLIIGLRILVTSANTLAATSSTPPRMSPF